MVNPLPLAQCKVEYYYRQTCLLHDSLVRVHCVASQLKQDGVWHYEQVVNGMGKG